MGGRCLKFGTAQDVSQTKPATNSNVYCPDSPKCTMQTEIRNLGWRALFHRANDRCLCSEACGPKWAATSKNSKQRRMCPRPPNLPPPGTCSSLTVPSSPGNLTTRNLGLRALFSREKGWHSWSGARGPEWAAASKKSDQHRMCPRPNVSPRQTCCTFPWPCSLLCTCY